MNRDQKFRDGYRQISLSDCSSAEDLIDTLREAAELYRESDAELESAWQDKNAGKFWRIAARKLDAVADQLEKVKP